MLNTFFNLTLIRKAALTATLLTALSCIIIVLASYHGSKQLVNNSAKMFGESLIQQLSRKASNPLVQDDKLSLQSLLNELVNSPMIIHAVIYDVENRPIAEAGEQHTGLSLSASITFQDSIAGYTVITLNSQSLYKQAQALTWQLAGLSFLLVILVFLLSSILTRYISALLNDLRVVATRPPGKGKLRIAYRGNDELQKLAQQILHGPDKNNTTDNQTEQAMIAMDISNLPQLQQQQSNHEIKKHLTTCYEQLTIICKLYEGHLTINSTNQFSASFFPSDNENDYPFRALCSGYLIQQWLNLSNIPLTINIGIALKQQLTANKIDNELAVQETRQEASSAGCRHPGYVAVTNTLCQHPSVIHRAILMQNSVDDNACVVDKLDAPYQQLLTRQLSTLQTQITTPE